MKIVRVTIEAGGQHVTMTWDDIQRLYNGLARLGATEKVNEVPVVQKSQTKRPEYVPQVQLDTRRRVLDLLGTVWPSLGKGARHAALGAAIGYSQSNVALLISPSPKKISDKLHAALVDWCNAREAELPNSNAEVVNGN